MNTDEPSDEIRAVLDSLSPKEREILKHRFGIELPENPSLQELETSLQVTREQIETVEARARERLNGRGPVEPA